MKFLHLGCILCFAGCTTVIEQTPKQTNPSTQHALQQSVYQYTQDQTQYLSAFHDLNQDGQPDALVLLQGLDWCGSGGCTLLIYQGLPNQKFKLINKTTVINPPIYVSQQQSHGWKNLVVQSRNQGAVQLAYNGMAYPSNPSLLPPLTTQQQAQKMQLLIASK
ncbi:MULTISPECIES: hypothetical protein [Acinetobacter]|uniref:Uncharacterized protein n=1 Tax=Acinetobacter piscicola TaxID=2006115 RepID=A0A7S7AGQ7_9GAMM|nr:MULTISPECIES: hypothetical protein [Acinetobacter]MDM1756351.1 hypothetical protein [Acinetobacter sp. 256-1]MDM1759490.1 hypothetical protein [Acinetobacter sp. 251-1]QOW45156.1 hypothetical protein G0028_04140 [Acinetobacter piscicola]